MKIKQAFKKLSALCLALVMVLGISVPTVANAEEGSNVIDVVEVNGVQEAVVGEVASDAMTVPEGANYSVKANMCGWYDWTAEEGENSWLKDREGEQVFEDGHKYEMKVFVEPNEGYVFTEDTVMKINGEIVDAYVNVDGQYVSWGKEYSFLKQVDKIEINNVPTAEIGGKATTEGITIPEDAKYEITHKAWYEIQEDVQVQLEEGVVFEKGKAYRLQITVEAKPGCEMTYDCEVKVNGEEPYEYWGTDPLYIFQRYAFLERVDKIEINNVPTAEIGKEANVDGIVVPENANYEVAYTAWYDEETYDELQPGDKFEKGKKYSICVAVEPKAGYEFSDEVVIFVNGEEEYDEVYPSADYIELYNTYSFLEQIDRIEILDELPEAKVGETAGAEELEVPDDAKYSASYAWMHNDLNGVFTGEFETGEAYVLAVAVQPVEGCEFTEDVVVTIAGKPVDSIFVTNNGDNYVIMETHDLGENTIDKIEITATEPKAGEKISVENVKVPEDAKYEIVYAAWCDAKTGRELTTGTFQEGKQYQLMVVVETEEGIYFANGVKIMLNGKEFAGAKFDNKTLAMPFLAVCELGFDLTVVDNNQNNNNTNSTQNNNQGTTSTPSPATGDNTNMILWIALVVIAIAGMVVVVSKKDTKYNKY